MTERAASGGRGAFSSRNSVWLVTLAVVLTVVIPRSLMLQVSVIDWDESIYAIVAQQWVDGHVPYATAFDHKPIGLYGIFALFILAFGDGIWAIRLIPIVFVAGTALLLTRLAHRQFENGRHLGALAAALYGLLTLTNGGLASNTEILVNFFIVLAVCLLTGGSLDRGLSIPRSLAVGASLGAAFQVNYLAAFPILGVAAFYFFWLAPARAAGPWLHRYLGNGACMLAGFLLTGLVLLLPVFIAGDIRDYFALQLAYLIDYHRSFDAALALRRVSESVIVYWPFYMVSALLAASALWPRWSTRTVWDSGESARDRRITAWLVLWACSLLAAAASGYFYHHFFLLTVPGMVMLAVAFLELACASGRLRNFCALWLLLMGSAGLAQAHAELWRGFRSQRPVLGGAPVDVVARAADYMSSRLRPSETIYVYDGQPILYYLTHTVPPTRFAFPDSHLLPHLARRFGFTPEEKVREVLASGPRFVVARPRVAAGELSEAGLILYDALDRDYTPASAQDERGPSNIFERKSR